MLTGRNTDGIGTGPADLTLPPTEPIEIAVDRAT